MSAPDRDDVGAYAGSGTKGWLLDPLLCALRRGDRPGETYVVLGLLDFATLALGLTYCALALTKTEQTPEIYLQITWFGTMAVVWPTAALRILMMAARRKGGAKK